ncbi:MAG: GntR family transcriptional regulator [Solirubrobacteraceae bacterium]
MPLARVQRQSLEESVYEAVREGIISGELLPGDPLVEAQLSADLGISKTPVREALIRLARDGLVVQELHRRSRVATPTVDDVRQACEVRRWVEAEIAACAARDAPEEVIEQLEASIRDSERALTRRDTRRWAAAIEAFTDALVEYSGNRYGAELLERMRNVLSLIANVSQVTPGRRARSVQEHRAILDAIRARDPDGAAAATRAHLRSIEADSMRALEQYSNGAR